MKCYLLLLLLINIVNIYGIGTYIKFPTAEIVDYENESSVTVSTTKELKKGLINHKLLSVETIRGINNSTFNADGSFTCEFSQVESSRCQFGMYLKEINDNLYLKSYKSLPDIYAKFEFDKKEIINEDSEKYYANIGISGWSRPESYSLIEFSINENYENLDAKYEDIYEKVGDYVVDGDEYTLYVYHLNHSIYVSYRKEPRNSGVVNVSAHIREWVKLGKSFYSIEEVNVHATLGVSNIDLRNNNRKISGSFDFLNSEVYMDERDSKCPEAVQEMGYYCCSENCEIIYSDKIGSWGFENNEWCGCGNTEGEIPPSTETETQVTIEYENKSGTIADKTYQLFSNNGYNRATFNDDGTFTCLFRNSEFGICEFGYAMTKPLDEIGDMSMEFAYTNPIYYNVNWGSTGVHGSYYDIYFETTLDFYIIENEERDLGNSYRLRTYTIDDSEYTLYQEKNFRSTRIFSFRHTPRQSGIVNVTAHLREWEKYNIKIDKLDTLGFYTEIYSIGSSGKRSYVEFEASKMMLHIGKNEEEEKEEKPTCSPNILKQGYKCCSPTCTTVYTDEDGNWGIEGHHWCGCDNVDDVRRDCSWKILALGYECCPRDCKVVTIDKLGNWGVHNGQWCGC